MDGAELSLPASTSLGYATCPDGFFNTNKGNYRPQRSCGKGMLLHLFVILSTGGGCPPQCMLAYTPPPGRHPLDTPLGRHPLDTPLGRHPLADTPWVDTSPGQTHPSPLQQMATAADGTHPTGMHSCWELCHHKNCPLCQRYIILNLMYGQKPETFNSQKWSNLTRRYLPLRY